MKQVEINIAYLGRKLIPAVASKKVINKRGFTLIELMLYIGVVSVIIFAVSVLFFIVLQSEAKSRAIQEVEGWGAQTMQRITHDIRNANVINSPLPGQSADTLFLDTGNLNASDFILPEVSMSNLTFRNLSKENTPGIIQIEFTLDYNNLQNKQEYNYIKTFYGSASLR